MFQNKEEALEVAKLATAIGCNLRNLDKQTEGNVQPANRIDKTKFIENVVRAARGESGYNPRLPNLNNSDEAQMLDYLNREAQKLVPDVTQKINLHPTPTQQTPQPHYQMPLQEDPSKFLNLLESIDNSLKILCQHFIENGGKVVKKKKRILEEKPLPKLGEKLPVISEDEELKLLEEIKKEEVSKKA
jgi:hypothetical protein